MHYVQPVLGLAFVIGLAWALSENRRARPYRLVGAGLALQFLLAYLALNVPPVREAVASVNGLVAVLAEATTAGTSFVFGYLGGGPLPFAETAPGGSFIFAFQALPLVLLMSALSALFWHWGILPRIIRGLAWVLKRSLGVDGPVTLAAAANIFVGMIEAAIVIRPHLLSLSRSDLFVAMTTGLATIAGTVLVLYATFLSGIIDNPAGHLLVASLISAPAAVVIARLMVPPGPDDAAADGQPLSEALVSGRGLYDSALDAVVQGTADGVRLLISIIAMLVVFVGLVSLANQALGALPDAMGAPLSLERLLGWLMAPLAWLLGIPWAEASAAGALIGTKVVLNELIAYLNLAQMPPDALSPRSRVIVVYALCSFGNFAGLGIMLAGLIAMAPERKGELIGLGLKSLLAGNMAAWMTAAIVALIV